MESELSQIIEECVSFIGVDVNLADIHLLSRVSGLTMARAQAIIARVVMCSEEIFKIRSAFNSIFPKINFDTWKP